MPYSAWTTKFLSAELAHMDNTSRHMDENDPTIILHVDIAEHQPAWRLHFTIDDMRDMYEQVGKLLDKHDEA